MLARSAACRSCARTSCTVPCRAVLAVLSGRSSRLLLRLFVLRPEQGRPSPRLFCPCQPKGKCGAYPRRRFSACSRCAALATAETVPAIREQAGRVPSFPRRPAFMRCFPSSRTASRFPAPLSRPAPLSAVKAVPNFLPLLPLTAICPSGADRQPCTRCAPFLLCPRVAA